MLIILQLIGCKILGQNVYMHFSAGFTMQEKSFLAVQGTSLANPKKINNNNTIFIAGVRAK